MLRASVWPLRGDQSSRADRPSHQNDVPAEVGHKFETFALEHRHRPTMQRHSSLSQYGMCLHLSSSALPDRVDRGVQPRSRRPLSAMPLVDAEAGGPPRCAAAARGLAVSRATVDPGELIAAAVLAPSHRFAVRIDDDSVGLPAFHEAFLVLEVRFVPALRAPELLFPRSRPTAVEPHALAAAPLAGLPEEPKSPMSSATARRWSSSVPQRASDFMPVVSIQALAAAGPTDVRGAIASQGARQGLRPVAEATYALGSNRPEFGRA